MDTSFYDAILPPDGLYCAVAIGPSGKVIQTFHSTTRKLAERAQEIKDSGLNAYFALSTFKDDSSRRADNAAYTRSFFLDLDCGPGKPYPAQAEAAQALKKFVEETKLPEPCVVNSGRGLHVYWPLQEVLDTSHWIPLANQFKQLCLTRGFAIDPAVPADAARVLRAPDTLNFKADPALPVQIMVIRPAVPLDEFAEALPVTLDLSAAKEYGVDELTRAIAQGDYPTSEFSRVVRKSLSGVGCAQIANAVQNAATLEEPLWRAALSIAWRCTDAEKAIHSLSRDHPDYTPENTIRKAELTKGPTTCKWYKDNFGAGCEGCTQTITSPIALGRKVAAASEVDGVYKVAQQLDPDNAERSVGQVVEVDIPAYPFPYFRGVNGGVFRREKDKDGNPIEVEIYPYDLYLTSRFYDSDEQGDGEGELVQLNLHTPHDGIRRFVAPVTTLMSKDKLRDTLVKHGVITFGKHVDQIMAYLASSVKHLQKMFAAERTRNQMGWTSDNDGFVIGELEYTTKGVRLAPAASITRRVAPYLSSKGDLTDWQSVANFYSREGLEPHALTVLFGFGAPLLKLFNTVEVKGALINLMSNKGGTGKTTAQMVVNSIFGHPGELLLKKDDTIAAKIQWMGMMNSIPVTMDEITNITDEDLSALTYEIPQGRGKHRMESQINKLRVNTTTWCTFAISSSNSSMYDKLTRHKSVADGEIRRLIEIPFSRPLDIPKAESDAVFNRLHANYGLAGPVFIQYVIANKDEVRRLMDNVRIRFDNAIRMDQADRFYSHVLACAFTAGIICNKLGLLTYDLKHLFDYAVSLITGIREDVIAQIADTGSTAKEVVVTYINENLSNLLVINGMKNKLGVFEAPISLPRGPLRMRYEPDTRELWIPATALRELFVNRQLDVKSVLPDLSRVGFLKNEGKAVPKRIAAGAIGNFEVSTVRCYCIDGGRLGLHDEMVNNWNNKKE